MIAQIDTKTVYSFMDSLVSIKKYVKKAKEFGYSHLGIMDMDNLYGAYHFLEETKAAGIQGLLGLPGGQVAPDEQGVAPLQGQLHLRAHGQQHLGGHMAHGQAGEDGRARLRAQPGQGLVQVEAPVLRAKAVVGKAAQQHGLLRVQHARVQKLGEHALDAVGVLGHVFQKKNAALHFGQPGRAQQGAQSGQVAAPKLGAFDMPL